MNNITSRASCDTKKGIPDFLFVIPTRSKNFLREGRRQYRFLSDKDSPKVIILCHIVGTCPMSIRYNWCKNFSDGFWDFSHQRSSSWKWQLLRSFLNYQQVLNLVLETLQLWKRYFETDIDKWLPCTEGWHWHWHSLALTLNSKVKPLPLSRGNGIKQWDWDCINRGIKSVQQAMALKLLPSKNSPMWNKIYLSR